MNQQIVTSGQDLSLRLSQTSGQDLSLRLSQTSGQDLSLRLSQTSSQDPRQELIENIKKWTIMDTQLKRIVEKTKECREMKSKLSTSICNYLQDNNMQNTKIDITNGQIRLYEKKDYSPLTFSYVEECLDKIIPDKSHVEFIIQYLKEHREIKTSNELRRTYKGELTQMNNSIRSEE